MTENGCIDPLIILEDSAWPRCDSTFDCTNGDICVQPHPSTSLTRITFKYPNTELPQTVVWNGQKRELWQQSMYSNYQYLLAAFSKGILVIVDNFEPQLSFLPDSLPFWLKLLME